MTWTRRDWLLAAGALPLELSAISSVLGQRGGGRGAVSELLPPLGPPPTLPDKASFAFIQGTVLDGASSHPRPQGATDLIKKALGAESGDSDGFRPNQARIRQTYAKMVNVDPSEIVFVPSTQIGESFFGSALRLHERGSHVVSDHLHFVGSQQMYTDMQKRGLEVSWIKIKDNRIPLDELDKAIIKGKTKLVAVSHTAFVTGFRHDLKRVSEIAHAKGAMVYADVIQGAGNSPLDLADSGVDAACCASYKWLMSGGTAFMYVRKSSLDRLDPPFYHFSNYTRLLPVTHMYPLDTPGKDIVDDYEVKPGALGMFSMGYEPNTSALAGLEYTLPYIIGIGPEKIQAHAKALTDRLKAELPKRGYPLLTPPESRAPIVAVALQDAQRLAPTLRAANVKVTTRWNHLRISPSVFNDMDDVDRFLAALPKA